MPEIRRLGAPGFEQPADSPQKRKLMTEAGTECGTLPYDPRLQAVNVASPKLPKQVKAQIAALVISSLKNKSTESISGRWHSAARF